MRNDSPEESTSLLTKKKLGIRKRVHFASDTLQIKESTPQPPNAEIEKFQKKIKQLKLDCKNILNRYQDDFEFQISLSKHLAGQRNSGYTQSKLKRQTLYGQQYLELVKTYEQLKIDLIKSGFLTAEQSTHIEAAVINAQKNGYYAFSNLRYPAKYVEHYNNFLKTLLEQPAYFQSIEEQELEFAKSEQRVQKNIEIISKLKNQLTLMNDLQEELLFDCKRMFCDHPIVDAWVDMLTSFHYRVEEIDNQIKKLEYENIKLKNLPNNLTHILPKDPSIKEAIKQNPTELLAYNFFRLFKTMNSPLNNPEQNLLVKNYRSSS